MTLYTVKFTEDNMGPRPDRRYLRVVPFEEARSWVLARMAKGSRQWAALQAYHKTGGKNLPEWAVFSVADFRKKLAEATEGDFKLGAYGAFYVEILPDVSCELCGAPGAVRLESIDGTRYMVCQTWKCDQAPKPGYENCARQECTHRHVYLGSGRRGAHY